MAAASWKWYSNLDENEKTALEDELNEFTKLSKSDTKEERLIDLSKKEAQEQPDVGRIIESIAKMTWQEHSGLKYNGSGFLGKLMLGEGYRLGYFTAGHNLFDEGTQQVVNPKSVKLLFKNIRKYTIPILLSKLMCKPNILIVAYKNNKITIKEGKTHIQSCRDGIDFAALIFTGKIQVTEKFLRKKGLSFLNIGEPGTCGSKPNSPVQLYGFPQYIPDSMDEVISDSPMRILPGVELAAPAGNIPFHYYTLETKPGASGASISNKGGRVIAIHIRGLNKDRDEKGNWGIGFDIIREELLQCPDISSLASKAEPGTSDPHKTQGMLPALGKFLKNIGLEQYISSFEAEDIDMEVLEKCEHEELGQVLKEVGVTLGHKKKITEALQALRHEKRQIKEQMEKEQEREKDLLENVDANMFIKGLDSYTNAVERGETTFKVKVKDPNAPVDFYINGKKVSKSDTRCKYVNVGEGKHQLILHNIKMEDMGTIEARTPSNRGDEMLTSSTECEVAMGEHAPEVGDCGPVTGIPNKECCWKLPYKCEGVQQSPLEVTVMFRGKELKIGLDVNVIIHQGNIELSVINPKREKSGIYTVTMKNAQGESSRDINVNIMGVNETAAASNVKMSCGVIIGIVIAVIAVIANYYLGYKGGVGSVSKWVLYNNSPGCGADFISTPAECMQAAQKLGFTGQMNPGRWSDKPPGCSAGTEGFIYFNQDVVGTTGITSLRSLCLFPGSAVIPEAFALTIPGCEEEDDVVYWGHDLGPNNTRVFPNGTVADCANWCGEVEECKFWTFEKTAKKCWLKDDKGTDRRIDHDRVSGSKECADPKSDLIVSSDEGEAAEYHGAKMGLYRQLDGSSYQQVGGRNYLYQVLPERHWYISDTLMMKKTGGMWNPTESSSVPASGWKFFDGSEWRDDPELSVRMLGQELQCNTITITSSRCTRQEVLGDFRRIKNDVLNGHPVFRNSFNQYLRVAGSTTWMVGSQRDGRGAWLESGRVTSCPAHTNSGISRRVNRKHWALWDGKNWVEDPTFVVTCNDTVKK